MGMPNVQILMPCLTGIDLTKDSVWSWEERELEVAKSQQLRSV